MNWDSRPSDPTLEENEYDFDKELLDEWNDLFDMIFNNLSISQLDDSPFEQDSVCSNSGDIDDYTFSCCSNSRRHKFGWATSMTVKPKSLGAGAYCLLLSHQMYKCS